MGLLGSRTNAVSHTKKAFSDYAEHDTTIFASTAVVNGKAVPSWLHLGNQYLSETCKEADDTIKQVKQGI